MLAYGVSEVDDLNHVAVVDRSRDPITLVVQADKSANMEVLVRLGVLARSLGIREMFQAVRPPVAPVPAPVGNTSPR